jgi:hypothetical protein
MTTKAEIESQIPDSPEDRRTMLNALAARHAQLDKDQIKLHDMLATQVAEDEDENDEQS